MWLPLGFWLSFVSISGRSLSLSSLFWCSRSLILSWSLLTVACKKEVCCRTLSSSSSLSSRLLSLCLSFLSVALIFFSFSSTVGPLVCEGWDSELWIVVFFFLGAPLSFRVARAGIVLSRGLVATSVSGKALSGLCVAVLSPVARC